MDDLALVVTAGYPDLRKVINELQRMSINGKLTVDKDGMIHNEFKLQFLDAIRNGESIGTIRKMVGIVISQSTLNFIDFYMMRLRVLV